MHPWRVRAARQGAGQVLWFVAALLAWQVGVTVGRVPAWLLPAPSQIAWVLWRDRSLWLPGTWITLEETLLGFGLAVGLGVVAALAMHLWEPVRRALEPWLVVSQTVPLLALAPLLAVWFGFGLLPKVLVVLLVAFFPVTVNLLDGLRAADPDMVRLLRTLGASRLRLMWEVELPSALPPLLSGVRLTAAYAVAGAVVAEWTGGASGLGNLMLVASSQFQTAQTFAAVTVVSLMGMALYAAVGLLMRVWVPWVGSGSREAGEGLAQDANIPQR
jgi:ABC-type nitrate/sulfonate/bicarbonate transport system permease component